MKTRKSDHDVQTQCPICGKSDQVVPIVYGYPSNETMREAGKGSIKLGGCVVNVEEDFADKLDRAVESGEGASIEITDKQWHCKRDDLDF